VGKTRSSVGVRSQWSSRQGLVTYSADMGDSGGVTIGATGTRRPGPSPQFTAQKPERRRASAAPSSGGSNRVELCGGWVKGRKSLSGASPQKLTRIHPRPKWRVHAGYSDCDRHFGNNKRPESSWADVCRGRRHFAYGVYLWRVAPQKRPSASVVDSSAALMRERGLE
jgi:hypothetical protein